LHIGGAAGQLPIAYRGIAAEFLVKTFQFDIEVFV